MCSCNNLRNSRVTCAIYSHSKHFQKSYITSEPAPELVKGNKSLRTVTKWRGEYQV